MDGFNQQGLYGAPSLQPEQPEPPKLGKRRFRKSAEKDAAESETKKVANKNLKIALALGVVAAALGGLSLSGATSGGEWVVRANAPIAAGTVIDVETQLEVVQVADATLIEDGAIKGDTEQKALDLAKADLDGMRAQFPISRGEQLNVNDVGVQIALSEPLKRDERLLSVQANVAAAVAGQIQPGDRVDIAASTDQLTAVVLQDVEVVSVTVSENQYQAIASQQTGEGKDSRPEELLPGAPVPGIYVVRVASTDAPRLLAADAGADLSLVYRAVDAQPLDTEPLTATSVICDTSVKLAECRS